MEVKFDCYIEPNGVRDTEITIIAVRNGVTFILFESICSRWTANGEDSHRQSFIANRLHWIGTGAIARKSLFLFLFYLFIKKSFFFLLLFPTESMSSRNHSLEIDQHTFAIYDINRYFNSVDFFFVVVVIVVEWMDPFAWCYAACLIHDSAVVQCVPYDLNYERRKLWNGACDVLIGETRIWKRRPRLNGKNRQGMSQLHFHKHIYLCK